MQVPPGVLPAAEQALPDHPLRTYPTCQMLSELDVTNRERVPFIKKVPPRAPTRTINAEAG